MGRGGQKTDDLQKKRQMLRLRKVEAKVTRWKNSQDLEKKRLGGEEGKNDREFTSFSGLSSNQEPAGRLVQKESREGAAREGKRTSPQRVETRLKSH